MSCDTEANEANPDLVFFEEDCEAPKPVAPPLHPASKAQVVPSTLGATASVSVASSSLPLPPTLNAASGSDCQQQDRQERRQQQSREQRCRPCDSESDRLAAFVLSRQFRLITVILSITYTAVILVIDAFILRHISVTIGETVPGLFALIFIIETGFLVRTIKAIKAFLPWNRFVLWACLHTTSVTAAILFAAIFYVDLSTQPDWQEHHLIILDYIPMVASWKFAPALIFYRFHNRV